MELKRDAVLGTYWAAADDLDRGVLLLEQKPYASVPSATAVSSRCSYCLFTTNEAIRCDACPVVFCSSTCRKRVMQWHKHECRLFQSIASNMYANNTSLYLLARTFAHMTWNPEPCNEVLNLIAHTDELSPLQSYQLESIEAELPRSMDECAAMLMRVQCNAHGVYDEYRQVIGLGFFPQACYFNHSCSSNIVYTYDLSARSTLPRIAFRTVSEVEQGSPLVYSYIDSYLCTDERKRILENVYFFECRCSRCEDRRGDDVLAGARDGIDNDSDFEDLVDDLEEELQSAREEEDMKRSLVMTRCVLSKAHAYLHPLHVLQFNATLHAFQLSAWLHDTSSQIKYATALVTALASSQIGFDSLFHPYNGRLLETLGSLLIDSDTAKAKSYWEAAFKVYTVAYGADAAITQTMAKRFNSLL